MFIGAAVKIVSDEQERLTILGTARGGVAEDVGGSNPFTPTKKAQESTFLSLFFVYCTPIFANALPFFNRATTISGFEQLALYVVEC